MIVEEQHAGDVEPSHMAYVPFPHVHPLIIRPWNAVKSGLKSPSESLMPCDAAILDFTWLNRFCASVSAFWASTTSPYAALTVAVSDGFNTNTLAFCAEATPINATNNSSFMVLFSCIVRDVY